MKELCKPEFSGTVLVCDDNCMNAMVICDHLKRVGLKVIIAQCGNDCIEKVFNRTKDSVGSVDAVTDENADKQFDLIFMDIHMPVMDGLETAVRVSEINSSIPIVALTTDRMFEDRETYKGSGIIDYLGKPFKTQELWQCLRRHLTPINN